MEEKSELELFKADSNDIHETNELSNEYEARMLEAFVGKPESPEKGLWYANSFSKFEVNGEEKIQWHWSWWAFFGGIWFLLYRKAYSAAGGLLLISIVFSFVPFGGLIAWVLTGGFSTYFVYKVYKTKKLQIEESYQDENKRVEMMYLLGGYNKWVLNLAVIINILVLILFLVIVVEAISRSA